MLLYDQITSLDKQYLKKELQNFFNEDNPDKDHTTDLTIDNSHKSSAEMRAREPMMFCGFDIIENAFTNQVTTHTINDGRLIAEGSIISNIEGKTSEILIKERVVLNLIQRLSSISTNTRAFVKKLNNDNIKILDTRKTTPGLRHLEKYAVYVGGGRNHRKSLSAGILIKDNHLAATNINDTVKKLKKLNQRIPVQIEIDLIDQISKELVEHVNGFLLDNMSPNEIKKCISKIKGYNLENKPIFIEVSGGINLNTIENYNIDGVNGISVGALTHHIKSVDITLDI